MDISLKGDIDSVQAAEKYGITTNSSVYATGYSDRSTVQHAKIIGAFGYVLKPFGLRYKGIRWKCS